MKRLLVIVTLSLIIAAATGTKPGHAQEASAPGQQPPSSGAPQANPLKVALLKWYPANLTTSFKVGEQPYGLAFDGANMWVSNNGDNTVTKLRASDGKKLGEFAVGQVPFNAAFDGEAIWVTNTQGASVTKLRASDGKVLGTFPDNGAPAGIVFDGTYVWVANFDTVTRFKRDGTQAGTFKVARGLLTLAFDGADIWVPNNGGTVTKLRASDGENLGTFGAGNADGSGIAFDGENLWLSGGDIVEMRPSDGKVLFQRPLNSSQQGVAFDGANIWVAGWGADSVFKL